MPPQSEIQELERIVDQIIFSVEDRIRRGEELPPQIRDEIALILNDATTRITELRQLEEQPTVETETPPTDIPTTTPPQTIPEGADLLWILAGGKQDAFVNYLRTYPDPRFQELLRNPSALQQAIGQLSQRFPEGIHLQADGIPHADLMSSNIYGYRYNPKSGKLLVRFNSGSVYQYEGVPKAVFDVFGNGAVPAKTSGENRWGRWWQGKIPSLGAAFYQMIRQGGYPYQRIK